MADEERVPIRHPIRVVSRRTGVSAAALRAWERRHRAVEPTRSDGGQRLYSDADIRRLALLKHLVDEGRRISQVAHLSEDELRRLAKPDVPRAPLLHRGARRESTAEAARAAAEAFLLRALGAVERMERAALERLLTRAVIVLEIEVLVVRVILPLLSRIGELWELGHLGPAQEHLASGAIRRFLEWLIETAEVPEDAPVLLACTPQGQQHEFGALLAGAIAAGAGWKAVFLGPDLPADEIASAAAAMGARAVALSATHGGTGPQAVAEALRLRSLLPNEVRVLAGGRAFRSPTGALTGEGIEVSGDLTTFRGLLTAAGSLE